MLHIQGRRLMLLMESDQLGQDVVALTRSRMIEDLAAGDHLEADSAQAHRDAHADQPRVVLADAPGRRKIAKIMIAENEVVGDLHEREAQAMIGALDHRSAVVHLVALMPRGIQPRSSGDAPRVGVVAHWPGLRGILGGRDDVDPRTAHQKHVRGAGQERSDLTLQGMDLPLFLLSVGFQVGADLPMLRRTSNCNCRQNSSSLGSTRAKPLMAARLMAARSVSSVLLPGSAGWRNCLVVNG